MELAQFILLLCIVCRYGTEASLILQDAPVVAVTRLNNGDVFTANGGECSADTCVGLSSGTAVSSSAEDVKAPKGSCSCQCHQHLPAFREDLHICVDDIHECILAPFVSGSTSQKIPFVFLPLKGQIIHPSKEISFTGVQTPLCVVSGAQFLTEGGWKELKNTLDSDVPFRLYRDEGRTFLQWVGEPELRKQMSGRLVLAHLLCRELANNEPSQHDLVFKPCVAFRVVGTPAKYLHNVSEVTFSADAHVTEDDEGEGLSISEYVAIGISSILLGMIYVASVFLYLHIRKRKNNYNSKGKDRRDSKSLNSVEEGIVKSNPLLGLGRHFPGVDNNYSESGSSENDVHSDSLQNHDDKRRNFHLTSALIHPQQIYYETYSCKSLSDGSNYDSPSIERLPEENVAIVETMEGRDDKPDTMRAITGTTRKKLYFNPAYFEPELLLAPPPAALEFLLKIREVITIAKQKMSCKRYVPSLIEIPEEDNDNYDRIMIARSNSVISLKRENSRNKICSGCMGCNTKDLVDLYGKLPEFPSVKTCKNCSLPVNDSKQRSIQKWLEDVPILKNSDGTSSEAHQAVKLRKHLRSPTRSLSPEHMSSFRTPSPRPASERARSPISSSSLCGSKVSTRSQPDAKPRRPPPREKTPSARRKTPVKPKAPPPPLPVDYNINKEPKLPPPDMISEAIVFENETDKGPNVPTMRKNMKAVIKEFAVQRGLSKSSSSSSSPESLSKRKVNYESDSLERSRMNKGFCTPTEYMESPSSHPSPSLSLALPMTEELTFTNAILDEKNDDLQNFQIPGLEDYEIIVVKKEEDEKKPKLIEANLYKLPELLQRSNGYSLVSEVYVNNGYNFESLPSSPCESTCSTLAKSKSHSNYEDNLDVKPGPLTIEVEDCPDNYIRVDDSDGFEPDTLDRKPHKSNLSRFLCSNPKDEFIDSLERPPTRSSFRNETKNVVEELENNFTRKFGSLREIYEFKTKNNLRGSTENLTSFNCVQPKNEVTTWQYPLEKEYEGRLLTLEERHSRRQRCISKPTDIIPPDVIPPPPHNNSSIYEHPKPPRKVMREEAKRPPLPPKNGSNRSTSQNNKIINNLNDNKNRASPTSEKSCGTASSCLSGASVSPYSSDYETCLIGEQTYIEESDVKKVKDSDEVKFKNALNNRYVKQCSPKPIEKKVVNTKKTEDVNNNNYYNSDNEKNAKDIKKAWLKIINQSANYYRVAVDSGYLSTDSSESQKKKQDDKELSAGGSETDESLGDGHSESGAESIETHSVFFGVYNNKPFVMDNGSNQSNNREDYASTDSETVSYTTVVPVSSIRSSKNKILRNPIF